MLKINYRLFTILRNLTFIIFFCAILAHYLISDYLVIQPKQLTPNQLLIYKHIISDPSVKTARILKNRRATCPFYLLFFDVNGDEIYIHVPVFGSGNTGKISWGKNYIYYDELGNLNGVINEKYVIKTVGDGINIHMILN